MEQITAEDLHQIMSADNVIVINVLSADDYADCHIRGSINIPLKELPEAAAKLNSAQKVVVYCASYTCHVSAAAYDILAKMGFKNLLAYEGGMKEWLAKKLPTEGACQATYLRA